MDPRILRAVGQQAKIAKHLNKNLGPLRQILNDPAFKQAYTDTRWIAAERNKAIAAMPDVETQRTLAEAARYFNSEEFRAQREEMLRASETMREHLGSEGIAAAQRIVGRRLRATDNQDSVVESLNSREARQLLDEATRLASSPEVRETLEQVEASSLLQLDATEAAQNDSANVDSIGLDAVLEFGDREDERTELSKEELLQINRSALQLFLILSGTVAAILVVSTSGLSLPVLLTALNGLSALSQWSEIEITKWEEDEG